MIQTFDHGPVRELRLDRPPANALSPELIAARAVEWCRSLLALPPKAMTATRRLARADLAALFASDDEEEILGVLDEWFSEETQRVMREVAERLTRKK